MVNHVLSQRCEDAGPHGPRGHDTGIDLRVLTAVEAANDSQKRVLVDKALALTRIDPFLLTRPDPLPGLAASHVKEWKRSCRR